MNTRRAWLVVFGIVAVLGLVLGGVIWRRNVNARRFGRVYPVRTFTGTNYHVQLLEVTVGKSNTGCVLTVYARFENPNPQALTLQPAWFVLVDHDKDYFSTTTIPPIVLPAGGALDKVGLNYVIPEDSLAGMLALTVGHHYFVLIKSAKAMRQPLVNGQFLMFHQLDW